MSFQRREGTPFFSLPTDNSEEQSEWGVKATIFRPRESLSADLREQGLHNLKLLPAIRCMNLEVLSLEKNKREKVVGATD